jgi:glycosyltransferase involved in cell wall biosynthesis
MITIVLATYNRPESLRVAIRSVLLQTMPDWRLLVIGDACDERTAAVVGAFADRRISYVNLPSRCGEQAIPNSIGMTLAESEYVALLNHDDVLLADHFAQALAHLNEAAGDLFVGKAAFARFSALMADGRRNPVFSEITPADRRLADVFSVGSEIFEPCSAWVFRRQLADTVGPWHAAATLYRTPMDDWLLRAWRAGANLVQSQDITVLRMLTHYQQASSGASAYAWGHGEHEILDRLLVEMSPGGLRRAIHDRLESDAVARIPKAGFSRVFLKILGQLTPEQEWLAEQFLTPAMAEVYLRTGWDAFEQLCLLSGFDRGHAMRLALRVRTGEDLPPVPDFQAMLAYARQRLVTGS